MVLTNEERRKFVEYLRQEIASDEATVEQMFKLNVPVAFPSAKLVLIAARKLVIKDMECVETVTITRKEFCQCSYPSSDNVSLCNGTCAECGLQVRGCE